MVKRNRNVLFLANIDLNPNEGIYKKIIAQAKGFKNANSDGWIVTKQGGNSVYANTENEIFEVSRKNLFQLSKEIILRNNIRAVYIRHMIPSFSLVFFLLWLKKNNIEIYYEIPTYPYFSEQFRVSKKKYRALVKIILDIIFWPVIYMIINHLIVIKSNSKVKVFKKMIEITNGADTHSLKIKKYEQNYSKISLVAVGTIYPYHGYDRILKGLKAINEEYNQKVIEINFIGKSSTLDDLKKLSEKLELKNVYFHGTKTTEELNDLYDKFDLGLGCLALHRRDADIDTTIKVIEYYCRGVAVLTSGDSPLGEIFSNTTIKIASNEDIIDLNYVLSEFEKITQSDMQQISQLSINKFSWNKIIFDLN
ncbi:glycosyltransferase [Streptococcus iniae]|uniref:glycosyltransferase n=4 Tax=Streptococcus iniae TaxID=1346 RepID=UPI000282F0D1|nr:glycosyltransferase [Streptococcus iniae]AJG25818.1 hypothetical protein SI82_04290 [Streptococcus iniae]APD31690.1 hypothetical protein BMF34_04165 [Streptococcus iniae]ASL34632.1 glycosyl transferases group 1 [Streptococcus iniae]ATX39598.1 hypothetical protein CTW00_01417 [Streptococcus iniae]AYB02612.1 glycosyltransferase [Streptococcus iniae]